MEEILLKNARTYAQQHRLELAERLGFGIHGIIFATAGNVKGGNTAFKIHRYAEPYFREHNVYE